ncbi:hypothetical protein SISNIDRAFT_419654 [Sistotremastrum niveocremeum HHB9708]|uniref:Retrovirus-related Pol polyprotein from transposon TNT 1-94-like beta-barrel domain-containing protein n=1 Tax=Sistotremastrum niveocremeum HHB9708 TaxID=1314777 RepID=A0A164N6U2_9AGAM|nr:hypothetical protein SISNIDRAFT_419654 [Sistotremastrum niveocremeum HHB9708]
MSPHRYWFNTYTPHRIPIRLTDGSIIYSAGIGSVKFEPRLQGKSGRVIEFHRVLHVPQLCSNLLSVLYLTRHKKFVVVICNNVISFRYLGKLLFTATVNARSSSNTAVVDGITIPISDFAGLITTRPLGKILWHDRFLHLSYNEIQSMISKKLVTGITVEDNTPPDPICELRHPTSMDSPYSSTRR